MQLAIVCMHGCFLKQDPSHIYFVNWFSGSYGTKATEKVFSNQRTVEFELFVCVCVCMQINFSTVRIQYEQIINNPHNYATLIPYA